MPLQPLRLIQGLLLFLPSTFLLPNSGLVIFAFFSILIFNPSFNLSDRLYFLFFIGVAINSILGIIISQHFPDSLFLNNGLVGSIILILAYLSARTLNDTTWRIVLFFLAIEALCIYFQFFLGIRFFFPQQEVVNATTEFQFTQEVEGIELLYFIRPMGLSDTSTIAGGKILIAFILIFMLNIKKNIRWMLILLFSGAAILNFKRSGIVSLGIFLITILILDLLKNGWRTRHTFFSIVIISFISLYTAQIINQLTRETASSFGGISSELIIQQLSGRASLWGETFSFIRENPLFGNYSQRLILSTGQYSHNSYLSLIANHGIFLTFLLTIFIIGRVYNKIPIFRFANPPDHVRTHCEIWMAERVQLGKTVRKL